MNRPHFQTQVNRLVDTFGPTAYRSERIELLWREVNTLQDFEFTRMVDRFIYESRQPPMIPEFRDEMSRERERNKSVRSKGEDKWEAPPEYSCDECKGSGVFLCTHISQPGFWAFRCYCALGRNDPRKAIPHYGQGHAKEYFYYDKPLTPISERIEL